VLLPPNLETVTNTAWNKAASVEGYIGEREFRALCMLAAAPPTGGVNVEIGSFKGKSTIGVASIASAFNLGDVVSVDPHNAPCETDPDLSESGTSFDDFQAALTQAGLRDRVEAHRKPSREAAVGWNRPIRLLWIDGDHTYKGAKLDFDLFKPFLIDGAIVAVHDTLHEFEGPIRVFVEDMLRSDEFGPASLLHTIGWAQYRPRDGANFRKQREKLAGKAARLIPLVANGRKVEGFTRTRFKLQCARIPHQVLTPAEFSALFKSTAT
jgi:predicted O-methyltransferase YrrM